MLHYYRNPKREELIIWDSEENELFIIDRIRSVQVFSEKDLKEPVADEWGNRYAREEEVIKRVKRKRKGRNKDKISKAMEMKSQGKSNKEIAEEVGCSYGTVCKWMKNKEEWKSL